LLGIAVVICAIIAVSFYYLNEKILYPQKIKNIDDCIGKTEYDIALSHLNKLPETKKLFPENQMRFYQCYLAQKQYFLALFHLNEILKRRAFDKNISEIDIHLKIADIYVFMNKNRKAVDCYRQILTLDPGHYEANYRLGKAFYEMKNFAVALGYLESAHSVNNSDYITNKYLAGIYLTEKKYAETLKHIEACLLTGQDEPELYFIRGQAWYNTGSYQESLGDMEKITGEPLYKNHSLLFKGLCCYHLKNYKEAEKNFEHALSASFHDDYTDPVLYGRYFYAELLIKNNKIDETIRQLQNIKNSGLQFELTAEKLAAYMKIKGNEILKNIFKKEIKQLVLDEIQKSLGKNGYAIVNVTPITGKSAFFTASKSLSAGQSYKAGFGFSFEDHRISLDDVKKYKLYMQKNDLSLGYFIPLFPGDRQVDDYCVQNSIEITHLDDFIKILAGEKSI